MAAEIGAGGILTLGVLGVNVLGELERKIRAEGRLADRALYESNHRETQKSASLIRGGSGTRQSPVRAAVGESHAFHQDLNGPRARLPCQSLWLTARP